MEILDRNCPKLEGSGRQLAGVDAGGLATGMQEDIAHGLEL